MSLGRFFGFLLFAIVMAALGFGGSVWYQEHYGAQEPPGAGGRLEVEAGAVFDAGRGYRMDVALSKEDEGLAL